MPTTAGSRSMDTLRSRWSPTRAFSRRRRRTEASTRSAGDPPGLDGMDHGGDGLGNVGGDQEGVGAGLEGQDRGLAGP
jgi:hypothetical protein